MNINVHIERLVLEGLPVSSAQGPRLQAALQSELARLLGERGLHHPPGGAVPRLSAGSIRLASNGSSAQVGHQIARAVHRSLAPAGATRRLPASRGGKVA
jgi:hypothetical protein